MRKRDDARLLRDEMAGDISGEIVDRVEVLREQIILINAEGVGFFDEEHQLQHAGGIDDTLLQQRCAVVKMGGGAVIEEVLRDEIADLIADECGVYGLSRLAHGWMLLASGCTIRVGLYQFAVLALFCLSIHQGSATLMRHRDEGIVHRRRDEANVMRTEVPCVGGSEALCLCGRSEIG